MKLRPLLITLSVLVPLSAVVWWTQRPAPAAAETDGRLGARVADATALASAAKVKITSAGSTLEFTRAGTGQWILAGEPSLPADISRLTRLGTDLLAPKIERLVSQSPTKLATYELDKDRVTYLDGTGKTLLDLRLGKSADGGGRLLAFGDENKAYLARLSVYLDASANSWRDTALLPGLSAGDIASYRISFADGTTIALSREAADKPWTSPTTPGGQQVKASMLTTQVNNLATLRYTGVGSISAANVIEARSHTREIVLTTFKGRTVTLGVARAPEPAALAKAGDDDKGGTTPPAAPRPVFVSVVDSEGSPVLAEAARTHAFEIADWIHAGLPATPADLFEPVPQPPAPAAPAVEPVSAPAETPPSASAKREPISVTTPPLSIEDALPAPAK